MIALAWTMVVMLACCSQVPIGVSDMRERAAPVLAPGQSERDTGVYWYLFSNHILAYYLVERYRIV